MRSCFCNKLCWRRLFSGGNVYLDTYISRFIRLSDLCPASRSNILRVSPFTCKVVPSSDKYKYNVQLVLFEHHTKINSDKFRFFTLYDDELSDFPPGLCIR